MMCCELRIFFTGKMPIQLSAVVGIELVYACQIPGSQWVNDL